MKRRIVLLIGTFAILSVVVWIYHLYSGGKLELMPDTGAFPEMNVGKTGIGDGWELDIQDRPGGRLRARYRARKWEKRGGGSYRLREPNIVMYESGGEHVYIRSDKADVYAEEIGDGWALRRGLLYGNVKIFLDRDTERVMPQDKPEMFFVILERDPRRVVRIYADTLRFNNDLLEIETDGRIGLMSDEADIYGHGFSMRWNEGPRELRELRILNGQYMAVYDTPSEFGVFSLPGAAQEDATVATQPATWPDTLPAGVAAATQAAAATAPATQPTTTTAPASGPAVRPAGGTTASAPATGVDAALAATRPTKPASTPSTSRPTTQPRNIYLVEFEGTHRRIHVDSGDRQLAGASKLTLMFEWGGGKRQAATRPATAPAASAPATSAPTQPTQPTQPATPVSEPVIITWSGPLTIRPIGYTPDPSSRRYTVSAEGELKLSEPKASATCGRLIYQLPQQRGWLIGDKDSHVRMDSGDDQEVVCRWMEFSRRTGMGYLYGPGHMSRQPKAGGPSLTTMPASATKPSTRVWTVPAGEDRIAWDGRVEITFGQEEYVDSEGVRQTRQFIKTATFEDNVVLTQGQSGDFVKCDKLYVEMTTDDKQRAYPSSAVASGNVVARQEASDIRAQEMTVTFEREIVSGTEDQIRLRPVAVTAKGEVTIMDTGGKDVMTASADRLSSDLVKRTAMLFGNDEQFATVTQGLNYLAGDEVHLDELAESAVVKGRGELKFFSDRDLSGGKISKPRPVRIEWDEGMEYTATGETANFNGNVVLTSGLDSMKCRNMQVMFEKVSQETKTEGKEETKAASDEDKPKETAEDKDKDKDKGKGRDEAETMPSTASAGKQDRRLGIRMEEYSRRKLSMIVANKDVVVRSKEQDDQGRLLQRLQMTGDKLVYDVAGSKMQVLGPGTLVAEDYRGPRSPKAKKADGESVGGIERPWQTLFEWQKSMEYWQNDRRVELQDRVSMVHRSGLEVLLTEKLNIPKWQNLPKGRKAMLSCQKLMAVFAEPKEDKAKDKEVKDKEAKDEAKGKEAKDKEAKDKEGSEVFMGRGPRLGPPELLRATGGVNLKDGPLQIMGERLIYELRKGGNKAEAVVWGSMPGKPVKNAKVYHEDPTTGQSRGWASPTITVYFEGREIKEVITKGVTGQGGT